MLPGYHTNREIRIYITLSPVIECPHIVVEWRCVIHTTRVAKASTTCGASNQALTRLFDRLPRRGTGVTSACHAERVTPSHGKNNGQNVTLHTLALVLLIEKPAFGLAVELLQ